MKAKGRTAKRVSLRGSVLFKLTSRDRLARALCVAPNQLDFLVENQATNYRVWNHPKTGRRIEEPKLLLKAVHSRVARLLAQIETPDYLHSGVKGRSYITNARSHHAQGFSVKIDVRKFFPSARAPAVWEFFYRVMEYPEDVAARMTSLLTFGGHLPTGGNASCILSFWAYKDMFDEIAALAKETGSTFTLYVDDMTITGRFASRSMQLAARKIIGRYHLQAHKNKLFRPKQPRVITGVAVTTRGVEIPNKRSKAISRGFLEAAATPEGQRLALLPSLIGRLSEAATIDSGWEGRKAAVVTMRRELSKRSSERHDLR